MKVNKLLRREFPNIKFGRQQQLFKCDRELKRLGPFTEGKIYQFFNRHENETESWVCLETDEKDQSVSLMQQVFDIT